MERSAFSGGDFEVAKWVNEALARESAGSSVEERASGSLVGLQMLQLELASSLDEACFEALGNVPRLVRDLERMRTESDALRGRLQQIELSLGGIEASTERNVALLIELDRVKQNMVQCASALREAERFTALSKGIEAGLGEGHDLNGMVGQIREVRKSLHILQNLPEFKNANARLAQLEKKLEVQLRPKFLAALRANDVTSILELRTVYNDIQQEALMKNVYFEARQEPLQVFFNSKAQVAVVEWLGDFYNRLLSIVTAEAETCQLLFGRERKGSVQNDLACHLLDHFARALAARMEGLSLKTAVELRSIAETAAQQLDAVALPFLEAPFASFVSNYGQAERDVLLGELAARPDADLFALAESAADRCQSLTKFSQLSGLVSALEAMFVAGVRIQQDHQQRLQQQQQQQQQHPSKSKAPVQVDQWNVVHAALKSLSSAKAVYRRLNGLDSRLRARILAVVANDSLSSDPSKCVLPGADQLLRGQIEAQRTIVFDAIFGSVRLALADLARNPVWTQVLTDVDPDLPKLRPDASPAVTRVIEHLFALPHHLENLDSQDEDNAEHWINVVCKAAVDLFSKEIQSIPKLSQVGALQLQTDVDALANLLSALGVKKKISTQKIDAARE